MSRFREHQRFELFEVLSETPPSKPALLEGEATLLSLTQPRRDALSDLRPLNHERTGATHRVQEPLGAIKSGCEQHRRCEGLSSGASPASRR